MTGKRRVALVGDYKPAVIAHQAIPEALRLASFQTGVNVEGVWLHTASIADPSAQLLDFVGILFHRQGSRISLAVETVWRREVNSNCWYVFIPHFIQLLSPASPPALECEATRYRRDLGRIVAGRKLPSFVPTSLAMS